MTSENELLDLCKEIVKIGLSQGASAVEAHAQSVSELEAEVELGQVKAVNRKVMDEIAIRLYIGKKMGSAFINIPTSKAAEEAISLAIAAAKATTEDEEWIALPEPSEYPVIEGLWDDSVPKSKADQAVKTVVSVVGSSVEAIKDLIPAFGISGSQSFHSAYSNSSGIGYAERGTVSYVVLGAVAPTESGMTPMAFSYDIQRGVEIDTASVVEDVVSIIEICRKPAKGKSGKHTVVMAPQAYWNLLQFTLMQSVRGDNVARGKSKIGDKIGEMIASEKITIIDDGTHPKGMSTSIADEEGVPRQRTSIIDKGILRSFLWDTYWANKMGLKSTGNAKRNMRQGLVEIAPSNIFIEPGERPIEDIISGIEHGYYIRGLQGAHSSNPESGDFSVVGNPAILIENGKMVGSINGLMISGNVFDMLQQVVEIARDPFYLFNVIGPEIVFREMDIIVKE